MPNIIYMATCSISKKSYIGCTSQKFNQRKSQHKHRALKSNKNLKFDNAIRKYGFDSFEWKILEECNSRDEMFSRERELIKSFNTLDGGYNSSEGGVWTLNGNKLSDDTKLKMSKSSKDKGFKPATTKYWKVILPDGEIYHIKDRVEFCNIHNLNYGSVRSATHRGKSYKNYTFIEVGNIS